ncbi:hypothetical_protein [Candidozyma auris]|uniref:hypothetical_protein n=1 Tax=Candidozyma auris TaxID=498019 RepID=UPI000D2CFA14|nr:hypothetical_protein [[Candida] auris]QEO22061.1 hypothetical_protein [[Candida] auris]GBL51531.1 hypothetical protein CAJCM15448_38050 [[Candida] auris]
MSKLDRVKHLTLEDVPKAARTLQESFAKDSLARLLTCHVKDPRQKYELDILLYEAYLRQHIAKGICLGIGESEENFETVAIWSIPSSIDDGIESFHTLMAAGYGKLWEKAGPEGQQKIFEGMLPLLHDTSAKILATDKRFKNKGVYTLVYLGSVASARGKGNVRTIFEYMFKNYIDTPNSNNIAYLESSSPDNIPIYNKFGFHFYKDITLGDKDKLDAVEGDDYAVMNVMIRGSFGQDWTGSATPDSLHKL